MFEKKGNFQVLKVIAVRYNKTLNGCDMSLMSIVIWFPATAFHHRK